MKIIKTNPEISNFRVQPIEEIDFDKKLQHGPMKGASAYTRLPMHFIAEAAKIHESMGVDEFALFDYWTTCGNRIVARIRKSSDQNWIEWMVNPDD